MQRDNFSYKNIRNAIKIIKEKEGYLSFYSGLLITLMVFIKKKKIDFFKFLYFLKKFQCFFLGYYTIPWCRFFFVPDFKG